MEFRREDNSILKPPIPTAVEGVKGYVHAYENGTAEVRHILLYECDIILECKVCKNLFRSLANFTSHKRFYCKVDYSEVRLQVDANSRVESATEIVQTEEVLEMTSKALAGENDPPDKGEAKEIKRKALTSIVDKLLHKAGGVPISGQSVFKPPVNATESLAKIQEVVEKRNALKVQSTVRLEAVEGVKNAVYQSNSSTSMKSEAEEMAKRDSYVPEVILVKEKRDEVTKRPARLSDVKKVTEPAKPKVNGEVAGDVSKFSLTKFMDLTGTKPKCTACLTFFSTELNLKDHIIVLHLEGRVRYLCPVCEKPFPAATNLRKHIRETHQKSGKNLEEALRKVVRKVHVNAEKGALLSPQKADVNVTQGVTTDQKNSFVCQKCHRAFPKQDQLTLHEPGCPGNEKTNFRPTARERHQSSGSIGSSVPELAQNKVSSIQVRKDYNKKPPSSPQPEKSEICVASVKALALVHSYTKADRCAICGLKLSSADALTRHIALVHLDWFRYGCTECDYKNYVKCNVSKHVASMHKESEKVGEMIRVLTVEEQDQFLLTTPRRGDSKVETPVKEQVLVSDTNDNIKLADIRRQGDGDNIRLADIKRTLDKTPKIEVVSPPIVSVSESTKPSLPNGVSSHPPKRLEVKPRHNLTPPTSQKINRKNLSTDRKLFIVLPMPKKKEKVEDGGTPTRGSTLSVESSPDSKASVSSVDGKENKAKKVEPIIASVSEASVTRKRKNSTPTTSVPAKRK